MLTNDLSPLKTLVDEIAAKLSGVTLKRMFGCDAFFANGTIFALIWKEGRIGVRLPDEQDYESLLGTDGATRWKAGTMTMSQWVLVPRSFHSRSGELARWIRRAHALAADGGKPTKPRAKRPVKGTKTKRPSARALANA